MSEEGYICRYCGRPIAVLASSCPWCGKTIMVVCAACKQYSDDHIPFCQQCGEPLVADTMEAVLEKIGLDEGLAQLLEDREHAQLLASGVVAQYVAGFFYDDGKQKTVLAELFGAPRDPHKEAAALLFSAVAYLVQKGYCALGPVYESDQEEREMEWGELESWDGQLRSLEGGLVRRAGLQMTIRKVLDQLIADEMDFRFDVEKPPSIRIPGLPSSTMVHNLSALSATTAIVKMGRDVELPEHQEAAACRETYQLLLDFVQSDPEKIRLLVEQIEGVIAWFERYEEDPSLGLYR